MLEAPLSGAVDKQLERFSQAFGGGEVADPADQPEADFSGDLANVKNTEDLKLKLKLAALAKETKSVEDFEKKKKGLILKNQIEILKKQLELSGLSVQARLELEGKLALAQKELSSNTTEDVKAKVTRIAESLGGVINSVGDLQQASSDKRRETELSSLDAEYNARIEAAKGNAKLQDKLRNEQAEKRKKIDKEASDREKALALRKALIAAAISIIEASPNIFKITQAAILNTVQLAAIAGYETGGVVEPKEDINGVIKSRPNLPFQTDNILIRAQRGEAVLNEDQQNEIKKLSGNSNIFAHAKVPSFQMGGRILPPSVRSLFQVPTPERPLFNETELNNGTARQILAQRLESARSDAVREQTEVLLKSNSRIESYLKKIADKSPVIGIEDISDKLEEFVEIKNNADGS